MVLRGIWKNVRVQGMGFGLKLGVERMSTHIPLSSLLKYGTTYTPKLY